MLISLHRRNRAENQIDLAESPSICRGFKLRDIWVEFIAINNCVPKEGLSSLIKRQRHVSLNKNEEDPVDESPGY